jgi:beta-xylosidase
MKVNYLFLLLVLTISNQSIFSQSQYWGDQGDGTYRNPILNADFPDVDVEQFGDTYYMISSKQHMSPGMVILESKDMVNWQIIGHVWDSLSWDSKYNWDRMDGYNFGVWAGDLAYHEGLWYCYQIDPTYGLIMSTATNIKGPWSEPHTMLTKERVFDDVAVFWDYKEKQAYLITNTRNKLRKADKNKPGNDNHIFKMSWDGREVLDEGKLAYNGIGAEAAKIYKFNDIWYIFISEWYRPDPRKPENPEADKNDRKQIVLRSKTKSIYGPYDKKIVFERGNGFLRSCSQGALMQAPDSSWWYTHQLIQNIAAPFQGRPQCLEPVKWIDGWPLIGKDIDGDGIGEPIKQYKKPINGFPILVLQTSDEFTTAQLSPQWEWNHNPRNTHWSLLEQPGCLRLKASIPVGDGKFWGACNTISQRIMGNTNSNAEAKFNLSGMKPGQRAGFVRFGGVYHLLGINIHKNGKRYLFLNANGVIINGPEITSEILWIRTLNSGDKAHFLFSTDGEKFMKFGPVFTIEFGKWTGDRLGFFCWNDVVEEGFIDIDYFKYNFDGPKNEKK